MTLWIGVGLVLALVAVLIVRDAQHDPTPAGGRGSKTRSSTCSTSEYRGRHGIVRFAQRAAAVERPTPDAAPRADAAPGARRRARTGVRADAGRRAPRAAGRPRASPARALLRGRSAPAAPAGARGGRTARTLADAATRSIALSASLGHPRRRSARRSDSRRATDRSRRPRDTPVTSWPPDTTGRIVHLEDEPRARRSRRFVAEGLRVGQLVRIVESTPERARC